MDVRMGFAGAQVLDFAPHADLVQELDCDTLLLHLPGFRKDQLRVQLTRTGVLKISGSRHLGDTKWSEFHKDFQVSENCDRNKISAKFEDGILYIRQPKLLTPAPQPPAPPVDSKTPPRPTAVAPKPDHKPVDEPKAVGPKPDKPVDEPKAVGPKPDKPIDDPKVASSTLDKPVEEPKAVVTPKPDKPIEEPQAQSDDQEEKDEKTSDEDTTEDAEKLPKSGDAKHSDEGETSYGHDNENRDKYNRFAAMDHGKFLATKMKMSREIIRFLLVMLVAFVLGMYVSNRFKPSHGSGN